MIGGNTSSFREQSQVSSTTWLRHFVSLEKRRIQEIFNTDDVIDDCEAKRCLAGADASSYIASDRTNWHCNACGRGFTESKNCRRHVREKHFSLDRDTCPHCNKEVSRRYIKDHIVTCKQDTIENILLKISQMQASKTLLKTFY